MFRAHRWPGTVRELCNVVRRMQMLPELPFNIESNAPSASTSQPAAAAPAPEPTAAASRCNMYTRVVRRLLGWLASESGNPGPDWLTLDNARREFQDAFELAYLQVVKQQSGGNKTRASIWAGVSRQAIQKLVRKHDVNYRARLRELKPCSRQQRAVCSGMIRSAPLRLVAADATCGASASCGKTVD